MIEGLKWIACFHCGPITTTITWLLFGTIVAACFFRDGGFWASCAFLISLIGAKTATVYGDPFIIVPFLIIAAFVVTKWRHPWAGKVLFGLYFVRVGWVGLFLLPGMNSEIFWIFNNEAFLLLQILVCILGGVTHGGIGLRRRQISYDNDGLLYSGNVRAKNRHHPRHPASDRPNPAVAKKERGLNGGD